MSAGQGGAGFKAPAMYFIAGMPAEVSNDVEAVEDGGEDMFARAGLAAE